MKVAVGLLAAVVVAAGALFFLSAKTALKMEPAPSAIGTATPVRVTAASAHGVRRITARVEQGGQSYPVFEQNWPSHRLTYFFHNEAPVSVTFEAGKGKAPNLRDGPARLVVEAESNDLAGRTTTASADVKVVLTPPKVTADGLQHFINQGGMELATFNVTGEWSEAGVRAGRHTFRSFTLPGKPPTERFAMFAFPWDLDAGTVPEVYARNLAGTESTSRFMSKVFPKDFRKRDLELDDAFLERVVNQIDQKKEIPGDLITRFLKINGDMRRRNNQQLADLRTKTEEKVLWNGPFIHWGKEESYFADVRTYMYKGRKVDQQVHLGFDLSDVQNAPVKVANDGRVVFAQDLGIYGNCVVVDHGYGLQSIYGHMNQIQVMVGDMVKKGQSLGVAGATGLAGGVHVHFSMQIDGAQVNPREWWDPHWIGDRILSKLPAN